MARSNCLLRSYAAGGAIVLAILFIFPILTAKAADESDKAESLKNVSLQLMDVAAEQIRRGAYSAARVSLEQANENRRYLTPAQQKNLDEMLAKTQKAADERQKIYENMQSAKAWARSNDYTNAIASLSAIQNSSYLTKSERTQIQADLASYKNELKNQQALAANTAQAAQQTQTKTAAVEEELLAEKSAAPAPAPAPAIEPAMPAEPMQPVAKAPSALPQPAETAPEVVAASKETQQCEAVEGGYIDKVMQQRNVQRSYTEAVVDDAAAKARMQMAKGDFAAARESLYAAWRVLDNNKILLGDELYKKMNDTLVGLKTEIDTVDSAAADAQARKKQDQAAQLQTKLRSQQEIERAQRIKDLMDKSLALQREQRYEDARGQLELLLAIDPLNEQALTMHQTLTDMINFRKQIEVRKKIGEQTNETLLGTDRSNIPYADEVTYPTAKDWGDISKRSREQLAGMSEADIRVNKQLDEIVDLSKLSPDMALADAIAILQNSVQPPLQVVVRWKDLEENAEITRLTRINMEPVSAIPLRKALDELLSSVSGMGVKLGFVVENGIITVATTASLPTTLIQAAYDISDLLGAPANFITDLTTTGLGEIQQAATTGGTGGGGGGGQRSQQQQQGQQQQLTSQEIEQRSQTRIQEVTTMIQEIEPDSWYVNGGKGTVRVWGNSLLVVQTANVHKQIADMIDRLRTSMGLGQQVSIEARFLLVRESFLEDIGFDVDFTSIKLGGKWDPLQVQQNSITTTSGAETNTALTAQGAYGGVLDDLQVQFLVKATQESQNGRSLQAPRVTVLSGESATLSVTTDQSYISNVSAEQTTGSGDNAPTATTLQQDISIITSGVILNVTPTISSDKKYVILMITTNTTNVLSLTPFTSTVAVSGGVNSQPIDATIYVPELQTTQVQTRVSVPDKGTLLLGGQKITDESEIEAGVPILGKIPIVGRLFNNKSTTRDQKVLLILVTPTIILQNEREKQAFPELNAAKM